MSGPRVPPGLSTPRPPWCSGPGLPIGPHPVTLMRYQPLAQRFRTPCSSTAGDRDQCAPAAAQVDPVPLNLLMDLTGHRKARFDPPAPGRVPAQGAPCPGAEASGDPLPDSQRRNIPCSALLRRSSRLRTLRAPHRMHRQRWVPSAVVPLRLSRAPHTRQCLELAEPFTVIRPRPYETPFCRAGVGMRVGHRHTFCPIGPKSTAPGPGLLRNPGCKDAKTAAPHWFPRGCRRPQR